MGAARPESTPRRSAERRSHNDMLLRERWTGEYDDLAENESKPGRHHYKDKSRSSGQREEKEHRYRDRESMKAIDSQRETERDRLSSRDRRKEDKDERVKDKSRERENDRERHRERDTDKEWMARLREKDREKDRERDLEGSERGREKERGKEKSRGKERDIEKGLHKDKERERENDKHRGKDEDEREKLKEISKDKNQEKEKERDTSSHKHKGEIYSKGKDMEKDGHLRLDNDYSRDIQSNKVPIDKLDDEVVASGNRQSASELEERISKMREERLKSTEGTSEILAWVNKSRKLEDDRNAEKEKALQLSKNFEEQDNMNDGSDDETTAQNLSHDLGGVKILHGIDKVLEGGAVVLTLKDQSILADGDINQEIDMLENVEIGEQKRRNEAYNAAKKKMSIYADKFSDEPGAEKRILPQYDDPMDDEGVTLDSSGRFTGEAERKLDELRKRIQGVNASAGEDLNLVGKRSSDYYTEEEMVKFKKPKKKKPLRKKGKLDLDALEAEAISAGLGSEDLGSRKDGRRRNLREEQDRIEVERRASAYQSAFAKAEEASKALRQEQASGIKIEEETLVFGDDDEELRKSLETARKIALKKREEEEKSGPGVLIRHASSTGDDSTNYNLDVGSGEQPDNKVVFTEMEEFVWGLQIDDDEKNPESEDVFMEEDMRLNTTSEQDMGDEDGGWSHVKEAEKDKAPLKEEEKSVVLDEIIREPVVGRGMAATLKLLQDRGVLKETVEWGGRNMDKKKSKLAGINNNGEAKEIRIERLDEYGRILAPKEAFRQLSHAFHGKEPGKMKQEKRMRQYQEELRVKRMKNADTPSLSVERMREAQAKLQTPYLVLSGHVKPGQLSESRSGFPSVEDFAGGLTPMLGDKKVEHFLNIQHKPNYRDAGRSRKPKPDSGGAEADKKPK